MLGLKRRTTADDVRRVAIAAINTALDDGKQEARKKPGLTGVRAVATGAVLYTGARAAFASRRFIRDRFGSGGSEARAEEEYDDEEEPEAEAEDDEPEAEYEDEYDDEEEPEAEADEQDEPEAEADEQDEPEAEADEDVEAADAASRRPPAHAERDAEDDADLPDRPSRSRAPVGRR